MSAVFRAPTRIVAGLGALADTAAELDRLGARRVVVVADRGLERIGALASILAATGAEERVVATVLADVNPAPGPVEEAAALARAAGAEAVLGIGGGSGLGAAKAVAVLLRNDVPLLSLEGADRAAHAPAPTVAIPTTAGSGSEVSNALVLHEPGLVREIVVRGVGYEPRTAILDATVLRGLPRAPLVFAALDALTHALEALWARGASAFTDACALHAGAEIVDVLPTAARGADDGGNVAGANDAILQRLLEASALANLACGNSGLALVHALSSSPAVELPHGLQNGVLLPHVARFNRDVLGSEGRALADALPGLYARLGFAARFADGAADVEAMLAASTGHVFRANNRRPSADDELRTLLREAGAADAVLAR